MQGEAVCLVADLPEKRRTTVLPHLCPSCQICLSCYPDKASRLLSRGPPTMGMFDYVMTTVVRCPLCGGGLEWQSKSGECQLATLTPHDLVEQAPKGSSVTFYDDCDHCRAWIEVVIRLRPDQFSNSQETQRRLDRIAIQKKSGAQL